MSGSGNNREHARTPEMKLFHESWSTKRQRTASRLGYSTMPKTPYTQNIFAERYREFKVVSKGKSTAEVLESSSYRPSFKSSFFDQCFTKTEVLGRGDFGEVVSVISKDTSAASAVKRQLRPYRSEYDRLAAFREVRNLELLPDHPNLLHLELAWEEHGRMYIQTELCVGNLDQYSKVHEVSELEVAFIFRDVLKALEALHEKRLIHYDVKPENILISPDGCCKLGDYGLVFDLSQDEGRQYHEGDNRYLDSAVLNSDPTPSSDIFSLGLTILELATDLFLPGNGERWEDLRHGILPEEFLTNLSPEIHSTIVKMLQRDPPSRPTATALLAEPFLKQLNYVERPQFKPLPPRPPMSETSPLTTRRSKRPRSQNGESPTYRSPLRPRSPPSRSTEAPPTPTRLRKRKLRCRPLDWSLFDRD